MARHELSDAQFVMIEPLLPAGTRRGRPWNAHRRVVNGVFWKLNTGVPWHDIPDRYGSWKTLYDRFVLWRRDGTWERILTALYVRFGCRWPARLAAMEYRWNHHSSQSCGSGCSQKKGFDDHEPTDHALGRSCGGFGIKLHILVDGRGNPLAACLTPGQAHKSTAKPYCTKSSFPSSADDRAPVRANSRAIAVMMPAVSASGCSGMEFGR